MTTARVPDAELGTTPGARPDASSAFAGTASSTFAGACRTGTIQPKSGARPVKRI